MSTKSDRRHAAGVYEQAAVGWRLVEWSRHATAKLALRAARKYAAALAAPTGGALSWSAWTREDGAPAQEVRV